MARPSGNSSVDLGGATVLVVEDHDFTRNLVVSVLRKIGVGTIREASGAVAAFRILGLAPVDVILCDIEMKPVDGLTFLKRLRSGKPAAEEGGDGPAVDPTIPVIMLTAHTAAEVVTRARDAGATAFLGKPIKPDLVRDRIEAVLAARRSTDPLWRLIYHSAIPDQVTKDDIKSILLASRRNNETMGITGALCMDSRHFLQVIEGPKAAVETLYARILADGRNAGVTLLVQEPADRRLFGSWSMLFVGADQLTADLCRRHCGSDGFEPGNLTPVTALGFLVDIASRARRP